MLRGYRDKRRARNKRNGAGKDRFWINYKSIMETRVGETNKVQKCSGRGKAHSIIGHEGQDRE